MPVYLKSLDQHLGQLTNAAADNQDRRTITQGLANSLSYLNATALAPDDPVVSFESKNLDQLTVQQIKAAQNPSIRQQRYALTQELSSLTASMESVSYQSPDFQSTEDRRAIRGVLGDHQKLADKIAAVCHADIDPVQFQSWRDTDDGRASIARNVAAIREQPGNDLSTVRAKANELTNRDLLDDFGHYFDGQFPGNQSDESRVTLSVAETVLFAKQVFEAILAGEGDQAIAPVHARVSSVLVSGQNQLRYNLPAEEGIATSDYWKNVIDKKFDLTALGVPSTSHLIPFSTQDQLPAGLVTGALRKALSTSQFDPVNPSVRYLDTTLRDDRNVLLNLAKQGRNEICVIESDAGSPVIVAPLDKRLPEHLVVTAPGARHTIISCPENDCLSHDENAGVAVRYILNIAAELEPLVADKDVEDQVSALFNRWRDLTGSNGDLGVAAHEIKLAEIHADIDSISRQVVAPDYAPSYLRDSAQKLIQLALLAGHKGSENRPLTFRLPKGAGTRDVFQPPALFVTDSHNESDKRFSANISMLNEATGEFETLAEIKSELRSDRTKRISDAVLRLSPGQPEVGLANGAIKGWVTHSVLNDQQSVNTGHWMSHPDRDELTKLTPSMLAAGLVYKKAPLFPQAQRRTPDEVARFKEAAAMLVHGLYADLEPMQGALKVAADLGCYALNISDGSRPGSESFVVRDDVFRLCNVGDIKRHLIQSVQLSGVDLIQKDALTENIQQTTWAEAADGVAMVHEELELSGSDAPGQ
ncbi:hypothetical protein [Marinobacter sp. ELB17]|uniref:hypothetical protein n=1 Tax=Marinobacter sp. ELB17 TaxID=270374 RepID=UPI0000F36AA2|nr:hypothetical protein [Marinobacter sp. ELB17]EAZ97461.1 hypothetical protein MELB17_09948 [Marinobacter sp. ELB17]